MFTNVHGDEQVFAIPASEVQIHRRAYARASGV
jgi:hypothetical protein